MKNQKSIKAIAIKYPYDLHGFGDIIPLNEVFQMSYRSESWHLDQDDENPDLIVFHFSRAPYFAYKYILKIRKKWGFAPFLIMITGETNPYSFLSADHNFSYYPDSKNNSYCPLFPFGFQQIFEDTLSGKVPVVMEEHRKYPKHRFCNFIYSRSVELRNRFCELLSKYKPIDCLGSVMNNTDELKILERKMVVGIEHRFWLKDKLRVKREVQKKYKFSIAFENQSFPGYITEKIWEAFISGTIPIYWGCPEVSNFFNPASFVNCHDYASFSDVIERVQEIDNDPELYKSYINAPLILPNSKYHHYSAAKMTSRTNHLLELVVQKREKYQNLRFHRLQNILDWTWLFLVNVKVILKSRLNASQRSMLTRAYRVIFPRNGQPNDSHKKALRMR